MTVVLVLPYVMNIDQAVTYMHMRLACHAYMSQILQRLRALCLQVDWIQMYQYNKLDLDLALQNPTQLSS